MYSLETLLAFSLIALIIGLGIGAFFGLRKSPAAKAEELEKHLTEMQQQQEEYQHEVTEHFAQTAQLLDKLTDSYRDVHNHLAQGAQTLTGVEADDSLKAIPSKDQATTSKQSDDVAPPLDYAPKTGQEEIGMLNEEFGLEKKATPEEAPIDPQAGLSQSMK